MPDFLSNRVNQEYINADQLINREVMNRQFALINSFKNETSKANTIDSNIKYSFDKLFEDFRNAVEGILSADYEDNLTLTKSYELIKKYNNLSSFLNNIVKLGSITERDRIVIKDQFKTILPLLKELRNVADSYNFLDRGEISDMVSKIEYENYIPVSADSRGVSIKSKLAEKNELVDMVDKANVIIDNLESKPQLTPEEKQQLDDLTIFFADEKNDIRKAFRSSKDSKNEEYIQYIKSNFDKLKQLQETVSSKEKYIDDRFDVILKNTDIATNEYNELSNDITQDEIDKAYDRVDKVIKSNKTNEIKAIDKTLPKTQKIQERTDIIDKWDKQGVLYKDEIYKKLNVLIPKIQNQLLDYKNNVIDQNLNDIDELKQYDDNDLDKLAKSSSTYVKNFQILQKRLRDITHKFDITPPKQNIFTPPINEPAKPIIQALEPVQQLSSKQQYHDFVAQYRIKNGNMPYKKAQEEIKRLKLWTK